MKVIRIVLLGLATLNVTACGGGSDGDPQRTASATFTPLGEAQRVVALWRGLRDMATVIFPYAHDAASLVALGGTSVNCLSAGTIGYVYTPAPSGAGNHLLQITFEDCAEALGVIDGAIDVTWRDSQDRPDLNRFEAGWNGTLTIDGAVYSIIDPSLIDTTYNTVSGLQETRITLGSGSSVQGLSGPSATIQFFRQIVSYTPGDTTASITLSAINFRNFPLGSSARIEDNGALVAEIVPSGTGILGMATPRNANFVYSRVLRTANAEPISGSATTSFGMMTMDLRGSSSGDIGSETFDWAAIIDVPDHDMRE